MFRKSWTSSFFSVQLRSALYRYEFLYSLGKWSKQIYYNIAGLVGFILCFFVVILVLAIRRRRERKTPSIDQQPMIANDRQTTTNDRQTTTNDRQTTNNSRQPTLADKFVYYSVIPDQSPLYDNDIIRKTPTKQRQPPKTDGPERTADNVYYEGVSTDMFSA